MVAAPILSGAILRIVLGLAVDRFGAKVTGCCAQLIVISGLLFAYLVGLKNFEATLFMGAILGFAGASFAVALPQAGRWYPPHLQGVVSGAGWGREHRMVLDALLCSATGGGVRLAGSFRADDYSGRGRLIRLCHIFQGGQGGGQKEKAF